MKNNVFFIVIAGIVAALIIGLPFAFVGWNNALVENITALVFYIISKVIFGAALIAFAVIIFVKPLARGTALFLTLSTIAMQVIPLFVRFAIPLGDFSVVYCLLVIILPTIGYLIFLALVFFTNKKQLSSDKKYEGKTIEVYEEKDD